MCYVHNQLYDISCATLYLSHGSLSQVGLRVLQQNFDMATNFSKIVWDQIS